MTTSELSLDAMRKLKSRRDELASQQNVVVKDDEMRQQSSKKSEGVRSFIRWFGVQRKNRGIIMSTDTMLDVQADLRKRFSIGMYDMRYFIAIPEDCLEWFQGMPWLHVAIGRSSPVLSLVCARTRNADTVLPEFALNFQIDCEGVLKMMANYHYLDVRLVTGESPASEPGRRKVLVSRDVYMTLDVRVVSGDGTFPVLLDGRHPAGLQTRSITRAKAVSILVGPLGIDPPKTPLTSSGSAR